MSGLIVEPSRLVRCLEFGFLLTEARLQVSCASITESRGQREAAGDVLNSLKAAAIRCIPPPDGDTLLTELDQLRNTLLTAATEQQDEQFLDAWSEFGRQLAESPAIELHDRLTSARSRRLDSIRRLFDQFYKENERAVRFERLGESLAEGFAPTNAALRLAEQAQQRIRDAEPTVRVRHSLLAPPRDRSDLYLRLDLDALPLVPDSGWHERWRAHWRACGLSDAPVVPEPANWDTVTTRDYVDQLRAAAIQRLNAAPSVPELTMVAPIAPAPQALIPVATAADLPASPSAAAATDPATAAPLTDQRGASGPILYHGGRRYSRGDAAPVEVSDRVHAVLQAFVGHKDSFSLKELDSRSGRPRADRVLATLESLDEGRFRTAIRRPGHRGQGGYRVDILDVSAPIAAIEQE